MLGSNALALLLALSATLAGCLQSAPSETILSRPQADAPPAPPEDGSQASLPEPPVAVAILWSTRLTQYPDGTFRVGANKTVIFDATHSKGVDVTAHWTLDDGAPRAGPRVTYVYEETGNYSARLLVQDRYARTSQVEIRVEVTPLPFGTPPPYELSGQIQAGNPLASQTGSITATDCGQTPELQGLDAYVAPMPWTYWWGSYEAHVLQGATGQETVSVRYFDADCEALPGGGMRTGVVPLYTAWVVITLELGLRADFSYVANPSGF